MIDYAVATDSSALLHACGEKSVLRAAVNSGTGLCDGIGMPVATHAVGTTSARWVNQPAADGGARPRFVKVPGPPPRGAPV